MLYSQKFSFYRSLQAYHGLTVELAPLDLMLHSQKKSFNAFEISDGLSIPMFPLQLIDDIF